MTVLSPGKSVIEHLQRSRRIKSALIDAIVEKMQNQATIAHTEKFQQLFYERIRHNKQLQNFESNILTFETFKRNLAAANLQLFEQGSSSVRHSTQQPAENGGRLPPTPRIRSDVALPTSSNQILAQNQADDSTSFYSNTFSTLCLANTSGVPAQRERGHSFRVSAGQIQERNNSMIELSAATTGPKKSNVYNRMSTRFKNAMSFMLQEDSDQKGVQGDQVIQQFLHHQDTNEESKQPFDISPQVSGNYQLSASYDRRETIDLKANHLNYSSNNYASHNSVQSSATDVTMVVRGGFSGGSRSSIDQKNQHESQRKIVYEPDGAMKLEALLADDTQECLTQEIIISRKSPNRLGTTYNHAFVQKALTIREVDSSAGVDVESKQKQSVQESGTIKMFPVTQTYQEKQHNNTVDNQNEIDKRFETRRRPSENFYVASNQITRHSVPVIQSGSKSRQAALGDLDPQSQSDDDDDDDDDDNEDKNDQNAQQDKNDKHQQQFLVQPGRPYGNSEKIIVSSQNIIQKNDQNQQKQQVEKNDISPKQQPQQHQPPQHHSTQQKPREAWEDLLIDSHDEGGNFTGAAADNYRPGDEHPITEIVPEAQRPSHPVTEVVPASQRPSLRVLDAIKVDRTTSDAAMMHLLEKNNEQNTMAAPSSFVGTIASSAEMRTEEGQERLVDDNGENGFDQTLAQLLFDAEQHQDGFDVEEYLLGDDEDKDRRSQADFIVRNRAALDRLNSIRLSTNMSNQRLSQRIARFSVNKYTAANQVSQGGGPPQQQARPEMNNPNLLAISQVKDSVSTLNNADDRLSQSTVGQTSKQDSAFFKDNYLVSKKAESLVSQPSILSNPQPLPSSTSIETDSMAFKKQFTQCGAQPHATNIEAGDAGDDDNNLMLQMDRLIMMERERVLKQADQKMAKIERTHRDSILRGRGYSIALGTNNVLSQAASTSSQNHHPNQIIEEESMSPSGLLNDGDDDDDDEDLLLDGADDYSMLLDDFEKDNVEITQKLVSFDRAIEDNENGDNQHKQLQLRKSDSTGLVKQDSAEVLSEDISESTETPRTDQKPSQSSQSSSTTKSRIGQGISSKNSATAQSSSQNQRKQVIKKPKVMVTQGSLESGSALSINKQTLPKQHSLIGFSQQKPLNTTAAAVGVPCKKCKSLKKVKKQLKEKTNGLAESQDKLALAETEIQRLRTQLKEVHQYIEVLEKQNQQIMQQQQQQMQQNNISQQKETQSSSDQFIANANTDSNADDPMGKARDWYENQLKMSTIIEDEVDFDDEDDEAVSDY